MKLKSSYFLKSNKHPARLTMKRKERERDDHIANIRNEGENITINPVDSESTIRECYEQLCVHKYDSLDKMYQFLKYRKLQN